MLRKLPLVSCIIERWTEKADKYCTKCKTTYCFVCTSLLLQPAWVALDWNALSQISQNHRPSSVTALDGHFFCQEMKLIKASALEWCFHQANTNFLYYISFIRFSQSTKPTKKLPPLCMRRLLFFRMFRWGREASEPHPHFSRFPEQLQ